MGFIAPAGHHPIAQLSNFNTSPIAVASHPERCKTLARGEGLGSARPRTPGRLSAKTAQSCFAKHRVGRILRKEARRLAAEGKK